MEVAPNVVDATADVLPPPDVVESLELDLRVPAFDPVDSDDELEDAFPRDESSGVPLEAVVEPAGFGARSVGGTNQATKQTVGVGFIQPSTAHSAGECGRRACRSDRPGGGRPVRHREQ